jgi:transcriptional regulator with XRE-family HTH domain
LRGAALPMGDRLRALRQRRGLTLAYVAARVGVTKACICQWEGGKSFPRRGSLEPLADALSTSVSYLIAGEGEVDEAKPHNRPAAPDPGDVMRRARREIARVLGLKVSDIAVEITLPNGDGISLQGRLNAARSIHAREPANHQSDNLPLLRSSY